MTKGLFGNGFFLELTSKEFVRTEFLLSAYNCWCFVFYFKHKEEKKRVISNNNRDLTACKWDISISVRLLLVKAFMISISKPFG